MSKTVRTVDSSATLVDTLKLMVKYEIGCLVVTERGKPVGIVTERDIMKRLDRGASVLLQPVRQTALKPLITAKPGTKIWEAFLTMLQNEIRRLPVMERGKIVGIVTERDLFKWVVRVTYEPNIPEKVKKLLNQNP